MFSFHDGNPAIFPRHDGTRVATIGGAWTGLLFRRRPNTRMKTSIEVAIAFAFLIWMARLLSSSYYRSGTAGQSFGDGWVSDHLGKQGAVVDPTQVPWESLQADRFENISHYHPGFWPFPVYWDRANDRTGWHLGPWMRATAYPGTAHDHRDGRASRLNIAMDRSLGALRHPRTIQTGASRIYIDLGAREPSGSVESFRRGYPGGADFSVFAFEADKTFAPMYKQLKNVTFIQAAISTFDGDCFFSQASDRASSMTKERKRKGDVGIHCVDLLQFLQHHVKPQDLVVLKMDIERAEFDIVSELLAYPAAARLIDEMMIECHHKETYEQGPHEYKECVDMFRRLQAAGIWMHEWF